MRPRAWQILVAGNGVLSCLMAILCVGGCASPLFRGASADPEDLTKADPTEVLNEPRLVGDLVGAVGMNYVTIESIGLVTSLSGTGSDPPPSPQRQQLIDEMQTHDVQNPNQFLTNPNNSMVLVRAILPPGVQEKDRIDVEVRVPAGSETTSLRGGWLMATRLKDMQVLGGALRSGHVQGVAEGHVVVDADFAESEDKVLLTRGRVLGGGVSSVTRKLGLAVRNEHSSIRTSTAIANAVNARFHTFDHGKKTGVATPKRDNYMDLALPPIYKNNVWRYMRVVRSIVLKETPAEKRERLQTLEQKLLEPVTSQAAALQLEAIGKEAITPLKKGLKSSHPEVRFFAAESLAYLDQADAAAPLAEAARNAPALRWFALAGLRAMDHVSAYDELSELLHVPSAETRYGALRTIRERNPRDPLVQGEWLGRNADGDMGVPFIVVNTGVEPLIHFSKSQRPEITLFGGDQRLRLESFLYAGPHIMLTPKTGGKVKITRFMPGGTDHSETCSDELTQVIPTIFRVGGGYAEALRAMTEAKKKDALTAKIAIDAVPRQGRIYHREETGDESGDSSHGSDELARGESRLESHRKFEPEFNKSKDDSKPLSVYSRVRNWFLAEEE